jgi:adenylate kinase family enzyme
MLTPPAAGPSHPRRLRIVGTSGSGKSHLARQTADRLGVAYLELDAVFWDADWTWRNEDEALQLVREFVDAHSDGWVVEGNWTSKLRGFLDPGTPGGADTFVWLDHPRPVVMRRVIGRTLRRAVRREELWHGNREKPSTWLRLDPEHNIMRWAWVQHPVFRATMLRRMSQGDPVVRLAGQRQVDAWLASLC